LPPTTISFSPLANADSNIALVVHTGRDPDIMYSFFNSSQRSGTNWMQMIDPTPDKLLAAGRTTLARKTAKTDYIRVQKLLDRKVYIDSLYVPLNLVAAGSRVQDLRAAPAASGYLQYEGL
jgi:ABC-type transport system substrate-binding protein